PLSIAIALFLTELAPRWLRGPIGTLVEMLAAVPSVVVGLWGILVMGPFVANHLEPWLEHTLGFLPLFHGDPSIFGLLPAILVLTIMITPIVSSVSRELFLGVPRDLKEGALALGTTRWEMIRGVVLPYARSGIAAALILGLGRAVGEAIATLAAFAAVGVLAIMVISVARRGGAAINLNLFTKTPLPFSFGNEPTGLANAFVGTAIIVGIATAMALPVGVLTAIYLNEFARPRVAFLIALALDVLNGVPAIVVGIFVFALVVLHHGQSALAGS